MPKIFYGRDNRHQYKTLRGNNIYASDDQRNMKISVEFDYKKIKKTDLNMIVSGFKQSSTTIDDMIKRGIYQVIK